MELNKDYIKSILPFRNPKGHKGTFGSALLITGSYSMAGAAILSGSSANRCGCGIVRHLLPKSIYEIVSSNVFESVYYPLDETANGCMKSESVFKSIKKIPFDSILIGCGCKNTNETKEVVNNLLLNAKVPIVLDADGINVLKGGIDILKKSNSNVILTPHLMEFSRISGFSVDDINKNRIELSADFAKEYNCTIVLKGHNTLIVNPDGSYFVNTTGNCGMSKGGSGDVLSGMIVSLLAQGVTPANASCISVYLHGLAGDIAADRFSQYAMTAHDIVNCIGGAFQSVLKD